MAHGLAGSVEKPSGAPSFNNHTQLCMINLCNRISLFAFVIKHFYLLIFYYHSVFLDFKILLFNLSLSQLGTKSTHLRIG